jgi:type IV pilus assembly protein PilA
MRHIRKTNSQSGFTLVELMVVVAIIGILASVALPGFRQNIMRAKVVEAIAAFAPCRLSISETYSSGGTIPAGGEWGCESDPSIPVSQYVESIDTNGTGKISVVLRGIDLRLNTHVITLTPLDNTGSPPTDSGAGVARWRCGSSGDGTDVPEKYLPASCRGG